MIYINQMLTILSISRHSHEHPISGMVPLETPSISPPEPWMPPFWVVIPLLLPMVSPTRTIRKSPRLINHRLVGWAHVMCIWLNYTRGAQNTLISPYFFLASVCHHTLVPRIRGERWVWLERNGWSNDPAISGFRLKSAQLLYDRKWNTI
uniref:Uncharacterized protein n=1 Tax=Opuntia streptacantha TaxID=393608 RepID=A0A7C8Z2Z2_OPUST